MLSSLFFGRCRVRFAESLSPPPIPVPLFAVATAMIVNNTFSRLPDNGSILNTVIDHPPYISYRIVSCHITADTDNVAVEASASSSSWS